MRSHECSRAARHHHASHNRKLKYLVIVNMSMFVAMFRERKSRSKSKTKLKLKRLADDGGSSRSPSVKSRGKEGGVKSDHLKIPVTSLTSPQLPDTDSSSD